MTVEDTEDLKLRRGRHLIFTRLDIQYYDLIGADSRLPRPSFKRHKEHLVLIVRLIFPSGDTVETPASIVMVGGYDPKAAISFNPSDIAHVPVGTRIELLRYESVGSTKPVEPTGTSSLS